ncbi:MAG: glycerol-3-phosphate dehydrogenase/oxidase [Acidiferrobacterales bacterium]
MDELDIIVIGGGIHGTGVAQAAAAAGYKTLLLEKTSLAAGTSSRSSKLIHGGLRYLETMQLGLVRESLRERRTLLNIAPGLVKSTRFYIPIYKSTSRRPWLIRVGLSFYALLAGLHHRALFHRLRKGEWGKLDGLTTRGLDEVFCYRDAQTDDLKLTEAVMRSAQSLGADLYCPAEFIGASFDGEFYTVRIQKDGSEIGLRCRALVNAAGPWANYILQKITPTPGRIEVDLVQGSHIVLEGKTERGVYYLEAPKDRRAVFVMPWHEHTLVGTTEKHYEGDPAKVIATQEEIDYLLETFRHYFPKRVTNIIDSFAGLRVLPQGTGDAFNRPRDITLHETVKHPGLITIYGGKLTGYRATAQKTIAQLEKTLGRRETIADTHKLKLT